jgi:hypothetical protein
LKNPENSENIGIWFSRPLGISSHNLYRIMLLASLSSEGKRIV